MIYSDVIKNNWHLLLPKKKKYTKTDIKKILKKINVSEQIARFIVLCTAIYYDTTCSIYIYNYNNTKNQIKRMI